MTTSKATMALAAISLVGVVLFSTMDEAKNISWIESQLRTPKRIASIFGLKDDTMYESDQDKLNSTVYKGKLCLLLTFHGHPKDDALNNIRVYTPALTNRQSIVDEEDSNGLIDLASIRSLHLQNLRGMSPVNDVIFVASAHSSSNKIIVVPKCGFRNRKAAIFTLDKLAHPYGIASLGEYIYVSNQNSDTVLKFRILDGKGANAKEFASVKHPRGLEFDNQGRLWVASTKKGIYVFNQDSTLHHHFKMTHPIGITCDRETGLMYIGSYDKKSKKKSKIYVMNPYTYEILATMKPPAPYKLVHPAGLAIDREQGVLFVVGQESRTVYAFDIYTNSFLGVAVQNLRDDPEQIMLSKCVF